MEVIYFVTAITIGLLFLLLTVRALDYLLLPLSHHLGVDYYYDKPTLGSGIVTLLLIAIGVVVITMPFIVLAGLVNIVRALE